MTMSAAGFTVLGRRRVVCAAFRENALRSGAVAVSYLEARQARDERYAWVARASSTTCCGTSRIRKADSIRPRMRQ